MLHLAIFLYLLVAPMQKQISADGSAYTHIVSAKVATEGNEPVKKNPVEEHSETEKLEKEVEENEANLPVFLSAMHHLHYQAPPRQMYALSVLEGWRASLYRPPAV